jgi:hypothetical protein
VAYFSRATSDRPVAHSSFHQSKVDQLAQSAMDNVIGDVRQEITDGSASPAPTFGPSSIPGPFSLYVPTSSSNIVPVRSPGVTGIPNLIRRSVRSDAIPSPARASRASAVNSTSDVSANGRSISLARWNSHYLVPKKNTGTDDSVPIDDFTNATPDWVFVTNAGATPSPAAADVIGRYAYAIYDEGGLVDVNAAGYPSPTTILQYGRKGSLAFADLTALPAAPSTTLPSAQVDNIVGWRNYASAQPTGSLSSNFSFTTTAATNYYNFILSDPNYIKLTSYSPIFFLRASTGPTPLPNNQTDQAFTTRQQLIALRKTTGFSVNALQYLGTLSREAMASAPQWSPTTPDSVNPNFQTLLVTASFTRNDGTTANVGDYLVDKRFLLQRLNWLTYMGPSATRTIPLSQPSSKTDINYDMWLLTGRFGLTSAFLQQGTATNILKYFGLAWDAINERWNYVGHAGSATPIDSIATFGPGGTNDPATVPTTRELDFFELLQAGILNGSLGDSLPSDPVLPIFHQQSKLLHILTIGANLIAQSRTDSYPVRIACNVGGTIMEAVGAPRLPYVSSLAVCPVGGTDFRGGVNWFLVPNLWDPFRDTWDLAETNFTGTSLTPAYPRPKVRITVSGSVGFGTIVNSPSVQSGSVPAASVTPFPAVLTVSSQSIELTSSTPTPTPGRDGFIEASWISTLDASPTPTPFVTTTSVSPTPSVQWNNIPYPSPTPIARPDGGIVVFRISLPGNSILDSALSPPQNPVLILQPGFRMTVEYQSPTDSTKWYSYSFLQGNNEPSTWISANNPANPSLNLTTTLSQYGRNPSPAPVESPSPTPTPFPTVLLSSTGPATPWNVTTLAQVPMFAKADPRSIRFNSQIGVINLTSPPSSALDLAGIIRSIWPNGYTNPPSMTIASTPTATPTPTPTPSVTPSPTPTPTPSPSPTETPNPPNPATLGDNAVAGNTSNPYNEVNGATWRPVMMNRPFRSVGEMAYAFRDQPFKTLSFSSNNTPDTGLLDLFTTNAYGPTPTPSPTPTNTPITPTPTPTPRGGVISLNSRQAPALATVLKNTIRREDTPRATGGAPPGPSPSASPITITPANDVATSLVLSTSSAPLVNRTELANLIANLPNSTGLGPSVSKTERESIARALGEVGQTRTWNLMLDVIAQTGRYAPGETDLKKFIVEGEQRYWVHVAIDRFTGQVIDKQIEVVNE